MILFWVVFQDCLSKHCQGFKSCFKSPTNNTVWIRFINCLNINEACPICCKMFVNSAEPHKLLLLAQTKQKSWIPANSTHESLVGMMMAWLWLLFKFMYIARVLQRINSSKHPLETFDFSSGPFLLVLPFVRLFRCPHRKCISGMHQNQRKEFTATTLVGPNPHNKSSFYWN